MAEKKIGFIGLGIMGKPMTRNLMKAGYSPIVYDVVPVSLEQMVGEGATPASSSKEVAERAAVVITMVPDSADSEAAILGPKGVLEGASRGSVVIDMSSIAPVTSQKIAAVCEAKGVDFLDAPVSGGEPGAIAGMLAIMVGGKKEVFDRHVGLLKTMGGSIVHCGDYGAGNTTKLANQIIVAANIEAVGEALVLARKAGLDPNVVFEAIKGGLAGSAVLNAKAPMMIAGDFKPGLPHQAAPQGPTQRPAYWQGAGRALADHQPGAADAGGAYEPWEGGCRPLGYRHLHRGDGRRRHQWQIGFGLSIGGFALTGSLGEPAPRDSSPRSE